MGLIDCSGKTMSRGRLPSAGSFPRNAVRAFRFDSCGVTHVDYNYFLDFPMIAEIYGRHNSIQEPFLIPPTVSSLDLEYNNLRTTFGFFNSSIPYDSLGSIKLDSNNISTLQSGAFKGFERLTQLSLSKMDNGIHVLEVNCIVDLPFISEIDISHNNIAYIPTDALTNLSSARMSSFGFRLNVRGNPFTELPENFVDLPYLSQLNLRSTSLETIHSLAFSKTPLLTDIDLSFNRLTQIDNGTFNLTFLTTLSLNANKLETLSGDLFRKGTTIAFFSVVDNNLRQIDRSLFTAVTIIIFDISLNRIASLPDTLTYPYQAHMAKLIVIYNQITFIPTGVLTGMKWLQYINLMGNAITDIESNALQRLEKLEEL
jgi:Leucine-rich repeat (LRR) protein